MESTIKPEYQKFTVRMAVQLAAPHTWPAAILPALVATSAAAATGHAISPIMACVLLAICILMQASVNTFNDYYDFVKGADSADDVPDVIVAAFDMTLQYDRLCRAAWWVSQGVPYIATNPDRVCPTDQPTVLVDCGSICACLEHATGRTPDIVLGKPDPNMLSGILSRHGLQPYEIAMVGDRIYTDVAMAHNAKAMGVLVLSGETTLDVADKADPQPHITADSIEVLGELIREANR